MNIKKLQNNAIVVLERHGAQNIKEYVLVSNWGFMFEIDSVKYDARFVENAYGAEINEWEIETTSEANKQYVAQLQEELNKSRFE